MTRDGSVSIAHPLRGFALRVGAGVVAKIVA